MTLILSLILLLTPLFAGPTTSDLSLAVSATPSTISLGNSVTIVGSVTNNGSGTKHITFEISSYSTCANPQHGPLFYAQDYVVPGHTTRTEVVTFTPDCSDSWEAVSAYLYRNTPAEAEIDYTVTP